MKKSILNNYIQEILSFSDDENQAIIESNKVTFERLGQSIRIEISQVPPPKSKTRTLEL